MTHNNSMVQYRSMDSMDTYGIQHTDLLHTKLTLFTCVQLTQETWSLPRVTQIIRKDILGGFILFILYLSQVFRFFFQSKLKLIARHFSQSGQLSTIITNEQSNYNGISFPLTDECLRLYPLGQFHTQTIELWPWASVSPLVAATWWPPWYQKLCLLCITTSLKRLFSCVLISTVQLLRDKWSWSGVVPQRSMIVTMNWQ